MTPAKHRVFRTVWWSVNLLLVASFISLLITCGWDYSVRQYLDGFSDAIVPNTLPAEQKVEAILSWMRMEPSRAIAANADTLARRDPQMTLIYQQLLNVCGTATNAFLNLARASDLRVRRLLLLGPDQRAKHVAAEVLIDGRWVVVDPAYRVLWRDAQGRLLKRKDLQDSAVFHQAMARIPGYPPEYDFSNVAHVRLARLPMLGVGLRKVLDAMYAGWEESLDWSLILERESFAVFIVSVLATAFFLALRQVLAWYADRRLRIARFRVRQHLQRAGTALFTMPEIK